MPLGGLVSNLTGLLLFCFDFVEVDVLSNNPWSCTALETRPDEAAAESAVDWLEYQDFLTAVEEKAATVVLDENDDDDKAAIQSIILWSVCDENLFMFLSATSRCCFGSSSFR